MAMRGDQVVLVACTNVRAQIRISILSPNVFAAQPRPAGLDSDPPHFFGPKKKAAHS